MKAAVFILTVVIAVHFSEQLTEKQVKSSAKLVRNSCQPKSKVTDEIIDNMHKGVWDEDDNAKCYMYCILKALKVIKDNGELDMELALPVAATLPERLEKSVKVSLTKCMSIEINEDKCDNAWRLTRCMYFDNPEDYFLP